MTCGVLIHIPEDGLVPAMKEIYRVSKDYILCAEYFSPRSEVIPYHGEEALWRRPYGDIWMENYGLDHVAHGFLWKRTTGLDNLTWFLLRKK